MDCCEKWISKRFHLNIFKKNNKIKCRKNKGKDNKSQSNNDANKVSFPDKGCDWYWTVGMKVPGAANTECLSITHRQAELCKRKVMQGYQHTMWRKRVKLSGKNESRGLPVFTVVDTKDQP